MLLVHTALKGLVQDSGLTQAELAEKVGVSRGRIAQILNGHRVPSQKYILKILMRGLGYDLNKAKSLISDWGIQEAVNTSKEIGSAQTGQSEALRDLFADEELLAKYGIHRWETVQDQFVAVPIMGYVSCGPFQDPEMQGEYLYPIDFLDRKHQYFCLRANGVSMLGKVDPGDIVLIEECNVPMPGKVMLFCHGEDVALGYLYEHEGYFEIKKANRDFPPILINDPSFQIKGWVKSVVKMRV